VDRRAALPPTGCQAVWPKPATCCSNCLGGDESVLVDFSTSRGFKMPLAGEAAPEDIARWNNAEELTGAAARDLRDSLELMPPEVGRDHGSTGSPRICGNGAFSQADLARRQRGREGSLRAAEATRIRADKLLSPGPAGRRLGNLEYKNVKAIIPVNPMTKQPHWKLLPHGWKGFQLHPSEEGERCGCGLPPAPAPSPPSAVRCRGGSRVSTSGSRGSSTGGPPPWEPG
jgi:hypothetical protein